MKQCCPWRERKVSLFHTPSTGPHQFPPPFQQKWKNEDVRNRGDQHQEQEKVQNGKETGGKSKESRLVKLN